MKQFYLLAACLLCSWWASAQPADSLYSQYATAPTDSQRVEAALALAGSLLNTQPDSAAHWAEKAAQLAQGKPMAKLATTAWNTLGMARYYSGQYPEALTAFHQYYEAARLAGDTKAMGFAKNNAGNVWIELGRLDSTLALYDMALAIRTRHKDTAGMAMSYNNLGYVHKELGNWEEALANNFKALSTFEALQDTNGIATTYTYLGVVFQKKNEPQKAQGYLQSSLNLFAAIGSQRNMAIAYDLLGNGYKMQGRYDSARHYFEKAGQLYIATNDKRQLALQRSNLADMYRLEGRYQEALPLYEAAIALHHSIGNQRGQGSTFISYAAALSKAGKGASALKALDSAFFYMSKPPALTELRDYYQTASEVYETSGNTAKALESARLHLLYHDSVLNETNIKAIADMETRYQTEKKEQEIALQQAELSQKNLMIGGVSVAAGLLLLLVYSYYRRQQLKQEKKLQQEIIHQQELASRAVMKAEETERRRIAAELHDGVGQVMSAARMNLEALSADLAPLADDKAIRLDKVLSLVDEGCREVRAVSHSMMPNALLKKGLSSALHDFIQKIDEKVIKVNLHMEGMQERLPPEVETVLYRLIQESVSNVIKHSGANRLDLSLLREKGGIDITVEDNGRGFETGGNYAGIGITNMKARIQYLKGELTLDSAPGKGTLVHFFVPLPG